MDIKVGQAFRLSSLLFLLACCYPFAVAVAAPSSECMDWVVGSVRHSDPLRAAAFRACDRVEILPDTALSLECAEWVLGSGTSTIARRAAAATACRFNVDLQCTEFLMRDQGNFYENRVAAASQCRQETDHVPFFHEFTMATALWILGRSSSNPKLRLTIAEASKGGASLACAAWVLGPSVGDFTLRLQAVEACNHATVAEGRALQGRRPVIGGR